MRADVYWGGLGWTPGLRQLFTGERARSTGGLARRGCLLREGEADWGPGPRHAAVTGEGEVDRRPGSTRLSTAGG
jgi:hypothetical protein